MPTPVCALKYVRAHWAVISGVIGTVYDQREPSVECSHSDTQTQPNNDI